MISEGSCDTEDWSNYDAENSVYYHMDNTILKHIQIENSSLNCNKFHFFI